MIIGESILRVLSTFLIDESSTKEFKKEKNGKKRS